MRGVSAAIVAALCLSAIAAAAEDTKVAISKSDCARLVRHQPSGDVAYKPGVDARGRKVASADVEGGANTMNFLPEVLEIPISINPFTYRGSAPVNGLENTAMSVATVKYDMAKGGFTLNGQPLGSPEQQRLAEACSKRGVK